MAWTNLSAEIAEEMGGYEGVFESNTRTATSSRTQRTQVTGFRYAAVPTHKRATDVVRTNEIASWRKETKAQRTHRRRKERAARVEGLARGQHARTGSYGR